ncbi:hypothetical protein H2200_008821 [Cladophialophora chaetospira]|uniref:Uncharacterized protein n=1 Tax=Cladophialophora chaetospira TaxID=386627 RepID=A0AA38X4X1_9EURO|nr:hypothetical protein H2200_008821 [Cladophialophora chaetospira]
MAGFRRETVDLLIGASLSGKSRDKIELGIRARNPPFKPASGPGSGDIEDSLGGADRLKTGE